MTAQLAGDLDEPEGPELTAGQMVAAAMQPVIDDYAEDMTPQFCEAPFVEGLTVLLKVLRENPSLVETISRVVQSRSSHLELQVFTDWDVTVLQMWALLLEDVSTVAYRYDDAVHGEISGLLNGARVRIVGAIPGDSIPEGSGQHEWTLPEVTG